jgi:ribosome-associated protein
MLSIQGAWKLKSIASPVSNFEARSLSRGSNSCKSSPTSKLTTHFGTFIPLKAIQNAKQQGFSSTCNYACRWYARPRQVAPPKTQQAAVPKKSATTKNKKVAYAEDVDEILEEEGEKYPYLDQPFEEKDVPEEIRRPMKEIELPKNKMVFNYKTYRYKDIQANDPDRVTRSFTVPAAMGAQVRAGESLEPIIHTKENPGEDLSKDLLSLSSETPIGLDAPVTSYASQMTAAIYDILVQEKAEDIVVIDINGKTNWVPTMIIVTAYSARHCVALANRIASELKRSKLCRAPKIERNVGDEWVIVATGTTIVEILTAENREYMDLERLWVLKKSAQETFEFDEEEERFMYDEEDGMWDDDDPDY